MERRTAILWLLVIAYAAGIFILSSDSNPPSDSDFGFYIPFFDKIAHFFIYLFFGATLYLAMKESSEHNPEYLAYAAGALYAFSDEVHQYFVPYRSTDPFDFLTDALALAFVICILSMKKDIKE